MIWLWESSATTATPEELIDMSPDTPVYVADFVSTPRLALDVAGEAKSDKLLALANLVPTVVVSAAKPDWSDANEADSSPSVSNVAPAVPMMSSILPCTNAVDAILVEELVPVWVGTVGWPVNAGEAKLALAFNAACNPSTLPMIWLWESSATVADSVALPKLVNVAVPLTSPVTVNTGSLAFIVPIALALAEILEVFVETDAAVA